MDEAVAQFTEITGSTPELANQYLQLADNNLEQAMQLYFESGGDIQSQEPPRPAPQPSSRPQTSSHYQDERGVVHIDSDDENAGTDTPSRSANDTFDDDLAMARRLQEEYYGGGGSGGGNAYGAGGVDAEGVRAPMARTTETLVGPGADIGFDDDEGMDSAIMQQLRARQQARRGRPGIFNQRNIWNNDDAAASERARLSRATGGASESSNKSSMLAEMYRPPFEIMSRLDFDSARDEGRANEKWILVNIQDSSVFDCQVLNRDIWKNPGVMDTIRENFIFLQYSKDDPRAAPYLQYYFPGYDVQDNYPHMAIIDPRTGEQVKTWSGPPVIKAADFLMQLHEFLDRYSLNHNARNPVAKRKAEKSKGVDTMTEEEMMEMAMKNSLEGQNQNNTPRQEDPDDLTKSVGDIKGKGKAAAIDEDVDMLTPPSNGHATQPSPLPSAEQQQQEEEQSQPSAHSLTFARIPSNNAPSEPPADADPSTTTRIQFRHPSGRVIRRFYLSDPVQRLYEWLKAEPLEGKQGVEFELVCMGRNLMGDLEEGKSVAEAGLRNGTVMVGFVED